MLPLFQKKKSLTPQMITFYIFLSLEIKKDLCSFKVEEKCNNGSTERVWHPTLGGVVAKGSLFEFIKLIFTWPQLPTSSTSSC